MTEHWARARGARQIILATRSELLPFHKENLMRDIVPEKNAYFYIAIYFIWDISRSFFYISNCYLCHHFVYPNFSTFSVCSVVFFPSVWKQWGVSPGLMASSAPSSSAGDMDPNTANLRQPATSRSLWITRFSLGLFTPWGGDVHHCPEKHTAPCEMSISWQLERQIMNYL